MAKLSSHVGVVMTGSYSNSMNDNANKLRLMIDGFVLINRANTGWKVYGKCSSAKLGKAMSESSIASAKDAFRELVEKFDGHIIADYCGGYERYIDWKHEKIFSV